MRGYEAFAPISRDYEADIDIFGGGVDMSEATVFSNGTIYIGAIEDTDEYDFLDFLGIGDTIRLEQGATYAEIVVERDEGYSNNVFEWLGEDDHETSGTFTDGVDVEISFGDLSDPFEFDVSSYYTASNLEGLLIVRYSDDLTVVPDFEGTDLTFYPPITAGADVYTFTFMALKAGHGTSLMNEAYSATEVTDSGLSNDQIDATVDLVLLVYNDPLYEDASGDPLFTDASGLPLFTE